MTIGNVVRLHAPSARSTALFAACAIILSSLLSAQTPQTPAAPAAREAAAANRLPVRRVVLYKSGVGYFEHMGRVRGNQTVTVDFTSGQLDDVLKSLTTIDLDGGRVLGISYNSDAGLERRLGALRLPIGPNATRADLLNALRGAKVEVRSGVTQHIGRVLSVEKSERTVQNTVVTSETLSLVSDAGEIQTVALDPGVSVRILEADLNQEVSRYLSLVASTRDQDVRRVSISTSGTGDRDLFVSYISEVPVWKPTYRLVLPTAATGRKPLLQGWAIIDNTVGEDWENVELSLVAGAPQSFVQAISRPLYVQRPVVALPQHMSLAPQTHQSAMGVAGAGAIAGTISDRNGGSIPGVTVRVTQAGRAISTVVTDANGRYQVPSLSPGSYEVTVALQGFRTENRVGIIVSGGMETVLNVPLQIGSVNETVTVAGASPTFRNSTVAGLPQSSINVTVDGIGPGRAGGGGGGGRGGRGGAAGNTEFASTLSRTDALEEVMLRQAQQSDANAGQLGDLFEYKLKQPVTIRKNQSALVPILSGDVDAEKVSLWNSNTSSSRPLRSVWVTNATGLTLDGGSFSVIDGQAFAGEGLMDPLKPGEKRLLSYAVDLGVQMDAKGENVPVRVAKVQIARGLVIQTTEERQKRTYTARNDDTEPRVLVIEHPVRNGWKVGGTVSPAETTAAWYRYRLQIEPKKTAMIVIDETRPGQTQYAVSNITDDLVVAMVRDELITPAIEASLKQILAQKATIAQLNNQIQVKEREIATIGTDQDRVRENMKSLKGSSEEKQLLQRYVKQLQDQEDRLEVLRGEVKGLNDERQKAQSELTRMIEALAG